MEHDNEEDAWYVLCLGGGPHILIDELVLVVENLNSTTNKFINYQLWLLDNINKLYPSLKPTHSSHSIMYILYSYTMDIFLVHL